jgi:hypothetical protein
MLTLVSTSEFVERIVHQLLSSGQYWRHLSRLRERISAALGPGQKALERLGLAVHHSQSGGYYLWVELPQGMTESALVRSAAGEAFSWHQVPCFIQIAMGAAGVAAERWLCQRRTVPALYGRCLGRLAPGREPQPVGMGARRGRSCGDCGSSHACASGWPRHPVAAVGVTPSELQFRSGDAASLREMRAQGMHRVFRIQHMAVLQGSLA